MSALSLATFDEPRYAAALDARERAILTVSDLAMASELVRIAVEEAQMPQKAAEAEVILTRDGLRHSEVYYLSRTILRLLDIPARAYEGQWTFQREQLPTPHGYVHLQDPIPVSAWSHEQEGEVTVQLVGFSWSLAIEDLRPDSDTLLIALWAERSDGVLFPGMTTCLLGRARNLGTNQPSTERYPWGLLVSFLSFVMQRIVEPEEHRPDRATARRLERARDQSLRPSRIQVIRLRRKTHQRESLEEERHRVDWACSWMVSGHWRTYTGKGNRTPKTIWISSYLKGNPELPLNQSAKKIFAVTR